MTTVRQEIMMIIEQAETDIETLAQQLGVKEKEVAEHLAHVVRTVAGKKKKLVIRPSACLDCGFTFKERRRPSRPSRCPKCKGQRITPPAFHIRG